MSWSIFEYKGCERHYAAGSVTVSLESDQKWILDLRYSSTVAVSLQGVGLDPLLPIEMQMEEIDQEY